MNQIYFAGYDGIHPKDFKYDIPEGFPCFLLVVTTTPALFCTQGEIREYPAHTAVLYPPGHRIWYAACGDTYGNHWIRFASDESFVTAFPRQAVPFSVSDPEYCRSLCQLLTWDASQLTAAARRFQNTGLIVPDKEEPFGYGESDARYSDPTVSRLLQILFGKLLGDTTDVPAAGHSYELLTLRRQIAAAPQLPWTVADMARQLHLSAGYLQLLYKQQFHISCVGDIKWTPAEVRNYFSKLPADSIPYIPMQVEVQIITREPKVKDEEIERVKKELRDFTDRINKGETTFSTLARMYSEDPGSARKGGEYGFTGRGELTPEFANVVFNLTDPKKISKVFETEYGYHIAQLIEKRGDRISYRHILLKPRVDEEEINEALEKLDTLSNDIRKGKFSFDEAATWVSQDKDTKNNHGLLANPQSGTSRFEMQQLAAFVSQEVAKVVEGMQIGEISKPFTMINGKGKEVCAIVKLKNRIDGHKAAITEDYQRLKSIVTAKRSEEKLQEWIVEKQKHTYVRINPEWRKCDFKYPGWIK